MVTTAKLPWHSYKKKYIEKSLSNVKIFALISGEIKINKQMITDVYLSHLVNIPTLTGPRHRLVENHGSTTIPLL